MTEGTTEYRFHGFRLESRLKKLFNPDGEAVPLSSRAFEVLMLLEHGGEA